MDACNKNLQHSLAVLSHPLTVLAFALYLANTFLFQKVIPSWWTGKIGDFAWLFFFPFVLCLPLSILISRKSPTRQSTVIYIAVALCGIPFGLLKGSGQLLSAVSDALRDVWGMSLDLTGDPGDLIALFSLWGAVAFWNVERPLKPAPQKFACLLAVASVLFTLADAAQPNMGIYYLTAQEEYLLACSTYEVFQSRDSGMTWEQTQAVSYNDCGSESGEAGIVMDLANPDVQYKFGETGTIYRSEDAGRTWTVEYSWKPRSDASAMYVQMKNQGNYYFEHPLGAVSEPQSGNIVFAMGQEGVLVRQPEGQYAWRQVGSYQKIDISPWTVLQELIRGEIYLGFLLGCLLVALFTLRINKYRFRVFLTCLALAGWLAEAVIFPPAPLSTSNYTVIFSYLGFVLVSFLALPLFVEALLAAGKHHKRLLFQVFVLFGIVTLTFPLPYALWALGVHDSYYLACLLAIVLEIIIAFLFFRKIREEFPAVFVPARKSIENHDPG